MTTRAQAIAAAGLTFARIRVKNAGLTPREQAEAAWTKHSRFTVDELEDLIRTERGLPPLHRSTPLPTSSSTPSQEAS